MAKVEIPEAFREKFRRALTRCASESAAWLGRNAVRTDRDGMRKYHVVEKSENRLEMLVGYHDNCGGYVVSGHVLRKDGDEKLFTVSMCAGCSDLVVGEVVERFECAWR